MTSERRKSIVILACTLVLGIMLGLLVPALFHKLGVRGGRGHGGQQGQPHKREWFAGTIRRVVRPDSSQAQRIKPITAWASVRIDSIEHSANRQMSAVLDSVRIQLKPILTDEQQKRLDDFDAKAKGNWNKRGRHHGR